MATQLEFFAEISKGPQTRRLELSSGSGEWGIPQETPVDETKRRAGLRREAHERLAYLQRSSVDDRAQIYQHILGPYGYSETEIAELSNLQSCALALTHLNQDWLLEEFISPDGSPSPFADQYYPQVDPEQYQYFGLRGGEAKKMLAKVVEEAIKGSFTEDGNPIATLFKEFLFGQADVVEKHLRLFSTETTPSIVVLPGELELQTYIGKVKIEPASDFVPPYGGENATRTLFVPFKD